MYSPRSLYFKVSFFTFSCNVISCPVSSAERKRYISKTKISVGFTKRPVQNFLLQQNVGRSVLVVISTYCYFQRRKVVFLFFFSFLFLIDYHTYREVKKGTDFLLLNFSDLFSDSKDSDLKGNKIGGNNTISYLESFS